MKNQNSKSKMKGKLRAQWIDEALKEAIQAIDDGYTMEEVSIHYSIPRTSLRDYISGKNRLKKDGSSPYINQARRSSTHILLGGDGRFRTSLQSIPIENKSRGDDTIKTNTFQARNSREFLAEMV